VLKTFLECARVVLLFFILLALLWAVESFKSLKMEVRNPKRVLSMNRWNVESNGNIYMIDRDCKELETEIEIKIEDWAIGSMIP